MHSQPFHRTTSSLLVVFHSLPQEGSSSEANQPGEGEYQPGSRHRVLRNLRGIIRKSEMDGEEIDRTGFPYSTRWPLEAGEHRLQVKFPRAFISSNEVTFTVVQ